MWYQIVSKVVTSLFLPVAAVAVAGGRLRRPCKLQHGISLNQTSVEPVEPVAQSISFGVKSVSRLYSLERGLRTVASNDSDQCSSRSKVSFAARQSIQCIRRNVGYP